MSAAAATDAAPAHRHRVRESVRVALTGAGSVAAALAFDAAWAAIPGGVIGLLAAFGAEWVVGLRAETRRLQGIERELAAEHEQRAAERELMQHRVQIAERRLAVSEAWTEIWGGAFQEAARGHVLPLSAIMARAEVTLKARGLEVPLSPPGSAPGQP